MQSFILIAVGMILGVALYDIAHRRRARIEASYESGKIFESLLYAKSLGLNVYRCQDVEPLRQYVTRPLNTHTLVRLIDQGYFLSMQDQKLGECLVMNLTKVELARQDKKTNEPN